MQLNWTGPFQIQAYLDNAISTSKVWESRWPPAGNAVYLVSCSAWRRSPSVDCGPLYVGGNTGSSERFCTRIGDLIADAFGFFGSETGHHSGGQSLWYWSNENRVHPGTLYLAWARGRGRTACARCAERYLFDAFPKARQSGGAGLLNKRTPPRCPKHS